MRTILALVALFALAWANPMFADFEEFVQRFNKQYQDEKEYHMRFLNYKRNHMVLQEMRNKTTAELGVTQFFDMSPEEFAAYPCGGVISNLGLDDTTPVSPIPMTMVAAPDSWDWTTNGAVTPVKNQGSCGSCWAFSTVGALEGSYFLSQKKLVSFAEQEFVDCSTSNKGCNGGWPFSALSDILSHEQGQVDTEAGYPYKAKNQACAFSSSSVGGKFVGFQSYCKVGTNPCTEADMINLLYNYGPLSACLDATPMQHYKSGVDTASGCNANNIDHCITIVGYGSANGQSYWKIKNSWGPAWGEEGYYRLIRGGGGVGVCGINRVITLPKF
jgi:C1A family cysteine protease